LPHLHTQDAQVQALIRFFFELCLLRRAPQDLPASRPLVWTLVGAELLVGLLVGLAAGLHPATSLAQGLAELALTLGALYLALLLVRHPGRFDQAASALLGTGALLGLFAVLPLAMDATGSEETDAAALGAVLLLALLVWSIAVTGHILRHTFGIGLAQGAAIALGFEVFAIATLGALFGTA
jgi:hypothetical protein